MSKPSARAASQTSRSFLPVLSAASISGQIHATRPVLVAGSTQGSARRWTSSLLVLFPDGETPFAVIVYWRPQSVGLGRGVSRQDREAFFWAATVCNKFSTICNYRSSCGRPATDCDSLKLLGPATGSKMAVVEHKENVARWSEFQALRIA